MNEIVCKFDHGNKIISVPSNRDKYQDDDIVVINSNGFNSKTNIINQYLTNFFQENIVFEAVQVSFLYGLGGSQAVLWEEPTPQKYLS